MARTALVPFNNYILELLCNLNKLPYTIPQSRDFVLQTRSTAILDSVNQYGRHHTPSTFPALPTTFT
jgi:hypothetical protein